MAMETDMTWAAFLSLLKFFPTLLDLATQLEGLIAQGVDIIQIRNALKTIDKAFVDKVAAERAKGLNDVFRKP